MYTRDTTYTCDRALYTATTRRLVNLHLAQHLGIRQPVYVVFDDHPGQLTPGPLTHQTASPSSPAQCAGRCLLCSGPTRHAHALARHAHARTPAPRAPMGTPPAADTRPGVLQQTRAVWGAGAALPRCPGPRSADLKRAPSNFSKSGRDGRRGAAAQHTHYGAVQGKQDSRVR
jgi:hypothetical protein